MTTIPEAVLDLLGTDLSGALSERGFAVDAAEARYVRFKPDEGAVIGLAIDNGTRQAHGYLRWCVRAERAAAIVDKAKTMRLEDTPLGPGVRRLNDGHTILIMFPNDLRLRRLRWVSSVRKLKRLLTPALPWGEDIRKWKSALQIVRYKPERRIISHAELGLRGSDVPQQIFLRYASAPIAQHLHIAARALARSGVPVPEPLVCLEGGRLHMERMVPGIDLVDAVAMGTFVETSLIEDTIRRIHDAPVPDAFIEQVSPLVTIKAALDSLLSYDERLSRVGTTLLNQLPYLTPEPEKRFIHGDMHLHQFVVGDNATVVDLERSAVGHPMADLGRWYAHTISLEERLGEEGAARVGRFGRAVVALATRRRSFDPQGFALHAAAGLVDQALRGARHVEPGWELRAATLLERAVSLTNRHRTLSI